MVPITFAKLIVALAVALSATAQAGPSLLAADAGNRQVLVMPSGAAATPGVVVMAGVRVEIAIEGGFRVYRAHYRGRTHTAYTAVDGPLQRFAFDFGDPGFREVAPVLRLRLENHDALKAIIQTTGAVGGKAYPALGWALLQLPPEMNPAEIADRLQSNPTVMAAEVQLVRPPDVPM